jgi:hypothetical protein
MRRTGVMTPSVPMFITGVATGPGVTVLMLPKARPRSPSPEPEENEEESLVAHSTAWFLIEMPPTVTVSYPVSHRNRYRYSIDHSRGRGAIPVRDAPFCSRHHFCGRRVFRIVNVVTGRRDRFGQKRGKDWN